MKKTVVLIAALLSCCLAYSQEANSDEGGTHGEITIIPRLDLDGDFVINGDPDYSFGLTSLYSLFEGEFADHFSFSVCNHWLNAYPGELYRNTFHSDYCNWLDWAYVTGQFGNFFITLGKDCMALATFENDAYDYDSHWQMNSLLWNSLQTYQWGGRLGWISTDGNSQAGVQITTSPFGEMFYSGKFTYTAFGNHDFENAAIRASVTFVPGEDLRMYALAGKYSLADVTLGADLFYLSDRHFGAFLTCEADFNDKLGIFGKVGYEKVQCPNSFLAGAALYCYPLRNSHDLRIHAMASTTTGLLCYEPRENGTMVSASIGVTYFFNITVF